VGEAGIIFQRLLLEKNKTKADMVLGVDQFQLSNPEMNSFFSPHPKLNMNWDESVPVEKLETSSFVAFSWSPMTFIYRTSDNGVLPKTLNDFTANSFKGKIILLDPSTSSPGYIFFHWVLEKMGEKGTLEFFSEIKKNVYNVTPSWSAGYGLFKKKQAQYIFSYVTSPVYHWVEEKNFDYQPLYLEDELPYHMEYAGILNSSSNKKIAEQFLEFLLEPETQKIIMNKNYMLPVIAGVKNNTPFENLKKIKLFESKNQSSSEDVLRVWKLIQW
jgi:thiamine transport system substrate-binding protein